MNLTLADLEVFLTDLQRDSQQTLQKLAPAHLSHLKDAVVGARRQIVEAMAITDKGLSAGLDEYDTGTAHSFLEPLVGVTPAEARLRFLREELRVFLRGLPKGVNIDLTVVDGDNLEFNYISVDTTRQGVGTATLNALTRFADQHGLTIRARVHDLDFSFGSKPYRADSPDMETFLKWYARFGLNARSGGVNGMGRTYFCTRQPTPGMAVDAN